MQDILASSPRTVKSSPRGNVNPRFFAESMQIAASPKTQFDMTKMTPEEISADLDVPIELIRYIKSLESELEAKKITDETLVGHVQNSVNNLEKAREAQVQDEIKQLKHTIYVMGKQNELTEDLLEQMSENYDNSQTELNDTRGELRASLLQAVDGLGLSGDVTTDRAKLVSQVSQLRAENTSLTQQLTATNRQLAALSQKAHVDTDDQKRRRKMDNEKDRRKFDEIADLTRKQQIDLDEATSRATTAEGLLKESRDDLIRTNMELQTWKSRYDRLWKHCGELEGNLKEKADDSANLMNFMASSMKESQMTTSIRAAQSTARINKAFRAANMLSSGAKSPSAAGEAATPPVLGGAGDDERVDRPKRTPPPRPAEMVPEVSNSTLKTDDDVWETPVTKAASKKFVQKGAR